jgi:hypothetical protein
MKVNTVGKILSSIDCAYIAGFIDGDGAIMAWIERHKEKKFGFRVRVVVKITQARKKDVLWPFTTTKIGRIQKNRGTFEWIVKDQVDVKWILGIISPYLHGKKEQAKIAIRILNSEINTKRQLYKIACLADKLSSLNVRSRNRRKNFANAITESISRND